MNNQPQQHDIDKTYPTKTWKVGRSLFWKFEYVYTNERNHKMPGYICWHIPEEPEYMDKFPQLEAWNTKQGPCGNWFKFDINTGKVTRVTATQNATS